VLRVFAGYVGSGLRPETYRSLVRYVPIGCLEMVNVSGDLSTYWLEFRKRWVGNYDLVTVEQDNVINGEILPSFNLCPEPWCVYEYEGPHNMTSRGAPDRMLKTSLGCTRFSQQLQKEVPITDISKKDYFSWYLIDYRIAIVLAKKGYSPHIHGVIDHLHDYGSSPDRLGKEDQLWYEAQEKTRRDPNAILAHPGMEVDIDANPTSPTILTFHKASDSTPRAGTKPNVG
jgi:hypothetical protein